MLQDSDRFPSPVLEILSIIYLNVTDTLINGVYSTSEPWFYINIPLRTFKDKPRLPT